MSTGIDLEPRVRAALDALAASGLPALDAGTPDEARRVAAMLRSREVPPALPLVADHEAPGPAGPVPVRLYRPEGAPSAAILYLHGGGWVLGGIDDADLFVRTLASRTGCAVASVGYRLAPEAPYPAGLEDCEAALRWLATDGAALLGDELPIVLLGDSAGGNLAIATAARARDRGGPAIAAQILAYPVADAAMDTGSYAEFADGPLLTASLMRWFWDHYAADAGSRADPALSPLRGELEGLPPTFVLTADYDVLRDEGETLADRLAEAGVVVRRGRYPRQIHGFLTMVGISDGGDRAIADIVDYLRSTLPPREPQA